MPSQPSLATRALESLVGAAVLLDAELRIQAHTEAASALLGDLPRGIKAAKILCGAGENRPIAEALAGGEAAKALVQRPTSEGEIATLAVQATPIREAEGIVGWILVFSDTAGPPGSVSPQIGRVLTRDPAMQQLLRDVRRVAKSDARVLIRGETGSGKELIAEALHAESDRAAGPFRALNCAALPPNLLESELFGHVRGAFTGAVRDAPGQIRLADKGTLFLDEVAELPLELQAKLLRVLQDGSVLPLGGSEPRQVDVRFVSATHRSLRRQVEAGRFRADLMYRLRVIPLFLPPLRERAGDATMLAERFIAEHNKRGERSVEFLSEGAKAALEDYDWPGNVRELQNAIEYAFVMGDGPTLTEMDLPPEIRGAEPGKPLPMNLAAEFEREIPEEAQALLRALERAGGNKERAAASLGISRVTLWRKLRACGLDDAKS